jgi:PleD family two-component response regulator
MNNNTYNSDFIEEHVNRMITGIRTFLDPQYDKTTARPEEDEEGAAVITINPATKKYCELKIKILQDSPRDADKLKEILQVKEVEYEIAQDSEDIERLVTEITS